MKSALKAILLGGAVDPSATALFARMTTAPTPARKAAITTLISALKAAGVWSKLDALYLMAAADSQAAKLNWIADRNNITETATVTFTADRGYAGDGITGTLDTNFNPTTAGGNFALNGHSMGVWSRTANALAGGGWLMGSATSAIAPFGDSKTNFYIRSGSTTSNAVPHAGTPGLYALSRGNATNVRRYKNGVELADTLLSSSALNNESLLLMRRNGAAVYTDNQVAAAHIGGDLTTSENLALYNAVNAYLTTVGAA